MHVARLPCGLALRQAPHRSQHRTQWAATWYALTLPSLGGGVRGRCEPQRTAIFSHHSSSSHHTPRTLSLVAPNTPAWLSLRPLLHGVASFLLSCVTCGLECLCPSSRRHGWSPFVCAPPGPWGAGSTWGLLPLLRNVPRRPQRPCPHLMPAAAFQLVHHSMRANRLQCTPTHSQYTPPAHSQHIPPTVALWHWGLGANVLPQHCKCGQWTWSLFRGSVPQPMCACVCACGAGGRRKANPPPPPPSVRAPPVLAEGAHSRRLSCCERRGRAVACVLCLQCMHMHDHSCCRGIQRSSRGWGWVCNGAVIFQGAARILG